MADFDIDAIWKLLNSLPDDRTSKKGYYPPNTTTVPGIPPPKPGVTEIPKPSLDERTGGVGGFASPQPLQAPPASSEMYQIDQQEALNNELELMHMRNIGREAGRFASPSSLYSGESSHAMTYPPAQGREGDFAPPVRLRHPLEGIDDYLKAPKTEDNSNWAFQPSHQTALDKLLATLPSMSQASPQGGVPGTVVPDAPPGPIDLAGRFAEPNIYKEHLDKHSQNLYTRERGPQLIGDILRSPYTAIEQFMQHGYQPGTNDVEGVKNSANAGLTALMAGSAIPENIAFQEGKSLTANKFTWDKERTDFLRDLSKKDMSGKERYEAFKQQYPEYKGKQSSYLGQETKDRNLGGVNIPTGAAKIPAKELFTPEMNDTIKMLADGRGSYTDKFNRFTTIHPKYEGSLNTFVRRIDALKEDAGSITSDSPIKGPKNWYDKTGGNPSGGSTTLSANRPGPKNTLTEEQQRTLRFLHEKYADQPGVGKKVINDFRARYPDAKISDQTIRTKPYISDEKKGALVSKLATDQNIGSDVPTKALEMLKQRQAQAPQGADLEAQVKDYLGQLGIRHTTHVSPENNTKYINYFPKNLRKGEAPPQIRIPMDPEAHIGRWPKGSPANMIDPGISPAGEGAKFNLAKTPTISNLGGTPYGTDIEAIKDAIKYRTSTAPPGENWLIPRDRAPHSTYSGGGPGPQDPLVPGSKRYFKKLNEPEGGYTKADPALSRLFSNQSDPTTAGILRLMQAKQAPGMSSGFPAPQGELQASRMWGDLANKNMPVHKIESNPLDWQKTPNTTKFEMLVARQKAEKAGLDPSRIDDLDLMRHHAGFDKLFSNQSDPTTAAIIRLMANKDPLSRERMFSGIQTSDQVIPNYRSIMGHIEAGQANRNRPVSHARRDLLSDQDKFDIAIKKQKLRAMGLDPDRIDDFHWKEFLNPSK